MSASIYVGKILKTFVGLAWMVPCVTHLSLNYVGVRLSLVTIHRFGAGEERSPVGPTNSFSKKESGQTL